jgi:hypothetical protein
MPNFTLQDLVAFMDSEEVILSAYEQLQPVTKNYLWN